MSGRLARAARALVVTLAAAALVAAPTATVAQQNAVGVNSAIQNRVQIKRGAAAPRAAVLKEQVLLNDQVSTGAASRLQIMLLDRSVFTVGANARIAIDRFVYDPARNSRASGVSVAKGAFRFMSGRGTGKPSGPVSVRTPVASIGIRGTIFEGVVGEDAIAIAAGEEAVGAAAGSDSANATLIVLRGPGPATQGDAAPGRIDVQVGERTIVLDRPGMAVYVPGPGAAPIQFQISQGGLRGLQGLLRTLPAGAAAGAAPGDRPADPPAGERPAVPGEAVRADQPPPPREGAPAPEGGKPNAGGGGGGGGFPFVVALGPIAAAIAGVLLLDSDEREVQPPENPPDQPRSP